MEALFSFLLQLLSLQFEGPIGLEFYIYIYLVYTHSVILVIQAI